jgi:hypothetical protein
MALEKQATSPSVTQQFAKAAPQSPLVRQLLAKKKQLEEQLDAVNKVLESEGYVVEPRHKWQPSSPITKAQAIEKALGKAKRPMRVAELVTAMETEGYVFNTHNKPNALNNLLYGPHKLKWLVKTDEGFATK